MVLFQKAAPSMLFPKAVLPAVPWPLIRNDVSTSSEVLIPTNSYDPFYLKPEDFVKCT
jgi:hypothetical protein